MVTDGDRRRCADNCPTSPMRTRQTPTVTAAATCATTAGPGQRHRHRRRSAIPTLTVSAIAVTRILSATARHQRYERPDYELFRAQTGSQRPRPNFNRADINANGTVNAQDYVQFRR